jgi:hypothetical protein
MLRRAECRSRPCSSGRIGTESLASRIQPVSMRVAHKPKAASAPALLGPTPARRSESVASKFSLAHEFCPCSLTPVSALFWSSAVRLVTSPRDSNHTELENRACLRPGKSRGRISAVRTRVFDSSIFPLQPQELPFNPLIQPFPE